MYFVLFAEINLINMMRQIEMVHFVQIVKDNVKVIHKENSRFLNRVFPIPCLYYELNMIIHTRYINI